MRPTVDEVLDGVILSFERDLRPELHSDWAVRISTVLVDALRHVRLRLAVEHETLFEEASDLRQLLTFLDPAGMPSSGAVATPDGIEAEVMGMRQQLVDFIDGTFSGSRDGERWARITSYLERQLSREGRLIPR